MPHVCGLSYPTRAAKLLFTMLIHYMININYVNDQFPINRWGAGWQMYVHLPPA